MGISILEDLGISKGEIKVYVTLLELGETKVGNIIEKSDMASSAVHNSVNTLIEKGLIAYIKKGKIKFYKAVPPKQLIDFIENKKKKVQEILPELEAKQKKIRELEEAEVFVGLKGIISLLNLLIEDTKKGDEFIFFPPDIPEKNEEIQKFYKMYDIKRKAKGLIVKGIAPTKLKSLFLKRTYLKMKYSDIPTLPNTAICNDKIALISWGEKPVGYIITSKQISKVYRDFFYKVWETS